MQPRLMQPRIMQPGIIQAMIKFAVVGAACCVLGACASTQEQASYKAPAAQAVPGKVVTDQAYVAIVERTARRRGIDVQWVNVPTKRVPRE